MSAPSPKFLKLLNRLRELFELDKADLDFGLYRVLRARREEIERFLRDELLPQVRDELGVVAEEKIKPMEARVQEEIAKVMEYGGKTREEAEASEKVVAAKSLLEQARNPAALEDEVYSLLTTFFSRYYEAGDFISQRRYSGPGKEKYMIPYNGEEVKLVWANMDQYYIKSAENFRDYTFRVPALAADEAVPEPDLRPRISFLLIEADTEKDNVKSTTGKRSFALADPAHHPLELATEDSLSVLRIPFTYAIREKDEKQADLLAAAEAAVLDDSTLPAALKKHLQEKAATATRADRTVLAKHLEAYAAKNSFDYFIHKDLGGFLSRELDYFLKSEVLRLDDLLTDDEHQRALTLKKARAFKSVSEKIVTFLHRQEQFQKKLWLKKKFVVATDYAITLDRIPEDFYPEIAANEAQREEWVKLHAIDEIEGDLSQSGYSVPLTVEFLKFQRGLMIDTRHFLDEFKQKLVGLIEQLDSKCDGIVIRSENAGGLSLIKSRYVGRIEVVATDPPYNTGQGDFSYKDTYQSSSWLSMISERHNHAYDLLSDEGAMWVTLDDREATNFITSNRQAFGPSKFMGVVAWEKVYSPRMDARVFSTSWDYVIVFSKSADWSPQRLPIEPDLSQFPLRDEENREYRSDPLRKWGKGSLRADRPTMWFPIKSPSGVDVWPIKPDGTEARWRWQKSTVLARYDELDWLDKGNGLQPYVRQYAETSNTRPVETLWRQEDCGSTHESQEELKALLPKSEFGTVKPTRLFSKIVKSTALGPSTTLDFFGGSGTTAHAVINLNREDTGTRKYILIEMGEHFETVLVPRIKKVVYSPDWKKGTPATRDKGISHCVKILRLESYEDCLNNLELARSDDQADLLSRNPALREDYLLGYFLNVETRGSVLKLDRFRNPWNYQMKIATGSVGETRATAIDLVETFNWLLGLSVHHQSALQHRRPDKGFSEDEHGRLQLTGGLTRAADPAKDKDSRTFQTIEGTIRSGEKVLVIWRSLTQPKKAEDAARLLEEDNVMLEFFLNRTALNPREKQWDLIYVNGDHTLENLAERLAEDPKNPAPRFKVRTIEPEFHRLMFEGTED